MSRGPRYFKNRLPDYSSLAGNVNCDFVQALIKTYVEKIEDNFKPTAQNADGGLYVGAPGVAFMFLKLSSCKCFQENRTLFLEKALSYVKIGIDEANRVPAESHGGIGASFLLGHAGIFGLASVVFHELGDKDNSLNFVQKFLDMSQICHPSQKFLRHGANELFVGRTGYLCMALWMNKMLGRSIIPSNIVEVLFHAIINDGKTYSRQHRSLSPLMYSYYDTEYLGAAHGLSAILQILLCFPHVFEGKSGTIETDMKRSADFLLQCKQANGNYPPAPGEEQVEEHHELVHWCHGAPGVVYVLVKAYLQWREDKYVKAAIECGDLIWQKGLLSKGPGICHGVAGNGYAFLVLYRLTNDEKYLHRAVQFGKFLENEEFINGARIPDSPYSLYEGLAGTVCFLLDLLEPTKAEFPFFDVFS